MAEAELRAQREEVLPQVLQHGVEPIRAHMGLGVDENVRVGAVFREAFQNPAVAGVLRPGVQLAVGEGARAALAKLDVGGGVEASGFPEGLHVPPPLLHALAPFQHNGPRAALCQHQRAEQSRRARAHHHGAQPWGFHRSGQRVDRGNIAGDVLIPAPPQRRCFVFDAHRHRPDQPYTLPGVHGAPQNAKARQLSLRQAQYGGGSLTQQGFRRAGLGFDVVDSQHSNIPLCLYCKGCMHKSQVQKQKTDCSKKRKADFTL